MKPNLLVFREELLEPSEPFVLAQGEALNSFRPVYVGLRNVCGLPLPEQRTVILGKGLRAHGVAARFRFFGPTRSEIFRLKSFRPVLVHAHFGMDGVSAMPLARALKVPLIVTFHGWDATVGERIFRRQSPSLNLYVRRLGALKRDCSRIVCVSEFIRGKILAKGFSPEKTVVHYIGVDLSRFTADPTVPREPIVLFVGRLTEKKGCEYLIRAMEMVQASVRCELVVIGDGWLRHKLERLARSKLRCFRFLGTCSADEVRAWMNRATVFSTPSIVARSGDAEGFGMVFAEAQAMGLPVASFTSGGIPEAVEHGVTGLLANERDVSGLANNILMLLTNRSLWQRFSHAARERAERLFDLRKQTTKLESIYDEVLTTPHANSCYAPVC